MPANFTPLTNITDPVGLFQAIHIASGGILGNGFILVSFVVSFIVAKRFESDKAFVVSTYITAIMAILLKQLSLVHDWTLIIAITLAAVASVMTFMSNN